MAHIHETKDAETHFIINATTREISNNDELPALVQNDHNSEVFTFVIPRYVDGHDMSLCNKTQVHYLNIDSATKKQYADVYEVEDLHIDETDDTKVVCSWLISRYATQYAGSLNFVIRYACEKDDVVVYAWNTAIFKGITVKNGINNTAQIMTEYTDILEKWKQDVLKEFEQGGFGGGVVEETDPTVPDWAKQPNKPEYAADEISYSNPEAGVNDSTVSDMITAAVGIINQDLPSLKEDSHKHDNKDTLDNIDNLFARKEEVPTVHEWAKKPEKPTYSADEISYRNSQSQYTNVNETLSELEFFYVDNEEYIYEAIRNSHTHANKDVLDKAEEIFAKKSEVSVRKTSAITFSPSELIAYAHDENRISLLLWDPHNTLRVGREIKTIQIKYNGKYIDIHELHTLDAIPYALNMNKVFVDEIDSGGYVLASLGKVGDWGAVATALRFSEDVIEEFYVLYYV